MVCMIYTLYHVSKSRPVVVGPTVRPDATRTVKAQPGDQRQPGPRQRHVKTGSFGSLALNKPALNCTLNGRRAHYPPAPR